MREPLGLERLLALSMPWASARKRLMRSWHAGSASKHARSRAKMEPALAPPAGEGVSSRSAQVHRRCTDIKRALVRTVGGAKHAKMVCFSCPETRPQAAKKRSKVG